MSFDVLDLVDAEATQVEMLPLADIQPNPHQPRRYFEPEALMDLSRSIVANGLLQPITVRRLSDNRYELVAGERRTMAFRNLGRERIPAIVREFTDEQSAVLALIENLQRKDLNFFEEAIGIAKLMDQLDLTQQQISVQLGKAQSTVANKLRLLRYSPKLQQIMLEANLTERHARALLKIEDPAELELVVAYIIEHRYNVDQTEQYVESLLQKKEHQLRTRLFIVKDLRMFQNSINKAVSMMNLAGIPVSSVKSETEEFVEYKITVPKAAVYKPRPDKKGNNQTRIGVV